MANLEAIDSEQDAIIAQHCNIQKVISQYLNQQNNLVTHGGSIPCHIVINQDREGVDRHLFYGYFAKNPRYNDQMFHRRY